MVIFILKLCGALEKVLVTVSCPSVEAMFTAMCECQALHPDPEDEDSDDYDGEEYDVEAHGQ